MGILFLFSIWNEMSSDWYLLRYRLYLVEELVWRPEGVNKAGAWLTREKRRVVLEKLSGILLRSQEENVSGVPTTERTKEGFEAKGINILLYFKWMYRFYLGNYWTVMARSFRGHGTYHPTWWPELNPWNLYDGMRELTPRNCPLIATQLLSYTWT